MGVEGLFPFSKRHQIRCGKRRTKVLVVTYVISLQKKADPVQFKKGFGERDF